MPDLFRPFWAFPLLVGCVTAGRDVTPPADDVPPPEAADTADSAPPAPVADPLAINELMADNAGSYTADDGACPDWIELYNPTDAPVDLAGWSVTDDVDVPTAHVFPTSLPVPARGFVLLAADGLPDLGPSHLAFRLSASGEEVALFAPDGRRVDWVDFDELLPDVAAARRVDGSEEAGWTYVAGGTPGASNVPGE